MREERYQVKSLRAGLVLAGLGGEDQHQVDRQGQEGQHQAESSQQGQRDLEDQDQEHQHHGGDGGQEVGHSDQEEGEADGQADGDCLDGGEAGAGDEEEEGEESQEWGRDASASTREEACSGRLPLSLVDAVAPSQVAGATCPPRLFVLLVQAVQLLSLLLLFVSLLLLFQHLFGVLAEKGKKGLHMFILHIKTHKVPYSS